MESSVKDNKSSAISKALHGGRVNEPYHLQDVLLFGRGPEVD